MLEQFGVRDWFSSLSPRDDADRGKRYCVDKDVLTLPTMALRVIERRSAGPRPVFDLAVNDAHSFVAGTVAVHNCIGNSGPLPEAISKAIADNGLVVAAVLSGNRNFEGRVHPEVRANYLASPPLVVAYALAGRIDTDLATDPLGIGSDGQPVYLRDVWPTQQEITEVVDKCITTEMFRAQYADVFLGSEAWQKLPIPQRPPSTSGTRTRPMSSTRRISRT